MSLLWQAGRQTRRDTGWRKGGKVEGKEGKVGKDGRRQEVKQAGRMKEGKRRDRRRN